MKIRQAKITLRDLLKGSRNLNLMKGEISSIIPMLVSHICRGREGAMDKIMTPATMYNNFDGTLSAVDTSWAGTSKVGQVYWGLNTVNRFMPLLVEAFVRTRGGCNRIYSNEPSRKGEIDSRDVEIIYEGLPALIMGMCNLFPWLEEEVTYLLRASKVGIG